MPTPGISHRSKDENIFPAQPIIIQLKRLRGSTGYLFSNEWPLDSKFVQTQSITVAPSLLLHLCSTDVTVRDSEWFLMQMQTARGGVLPSAVRSSRAQRWDSVSPRCRRNMNSIPFRARCSHARLSTFWPVIYNSNCSNREYGMNGDTKFGAYRGICLLTANKNEPFIVDFNAEILPKSKRECFQSVLNLETWKWIRFCLT